MPTEKENVIVKLTLEFAQKVVVYTELLEDRKKYIIARQLLKSGTSIGANVWESQNAESRNDFIHKLKIASKEANETEYWLLLCEKSQNYPVDSTLRGDLLTIQKVLSKIIGTTKRTTEDRNINQFRTS